MEVVADILYEILLAVVNACNLAVSLILNGIFSIFDIAIDLINTIVQFVFSSAGFLAAIAKFIPVHIYQFATICVSCIILRAIIKKVMG